MTNEDRVWIQMGKTIAFEKSLDAVIAGHPYAHLLHGRIAALKEAGTAQLLGEVGSDLVRESFEQTMDKIAAKLPTRAD